MGLFHDLGNLVQIASSAVNIIGRNASVRSGDLGPAIEGAKASLERAGALVRQTIGNATEQTPATEQVRLAPCLAEIEKLFQSIWENDILLYIRTDPDLPPLKCDPMELQSAILNLLLNARDAMPNGGAIAICAQAILLESGEGIELRVVDNGIGMTPDTVARAFESFFTTKSDGLGGVGLPMVERFTRKLGGRVFIESEYGAGTTVRLQLPVSSCSLSIAG
jgi:signal transduction histidine kinase